MDDIAVLERAHINYKSGLTRFMNNAVMYKKFLMSFHEDDSYEKSLIEYENKNYDQLYINVHTLKGIAGNLNIDGLYQAAFEITVILKAKNYEKLDEAFAIYKNQYNEAILAIKTAFGDSLD